MATGFLPITITHLTTHNVPRNTTYERSLHCLSRTKQILIVVWCGELAEATCDIRHTNDERRVNYAKQTQFT